MSEEDMNSTNAPPPPPAPPPNISPKRIQNTHRIVQQTVCDRLLPAKTEASKLCSRLLDRMNLPNGSALLSNLLEVNPLIQDGPMCGLVALCMASRLLHNSGAIGISQVFEIAKGLGYTLQGEMFSAQHMGELATLLLRCQSQIIEDPNTESGRSKIINSLLRGNPVLVPITLPVHLLCCPLHITSYDADGNHEPCMRRGQKAHWAILTGILIIHKNEDLKPSIVHLERDSQVSCLYHVKTRNELNDECPDIVDDLCTFASKTNNIYVYAKQGKSVHTGLWSLDSLLKSNANLAELDPKVAEERQKYVVPSEGIKGGLCSQLIVINKKS